MRDWCGCACRQGDGDLGAPVLMRVFAGIVGPAHPEDGALVRLDPATAHELEARGDAVRVAITPAPGRRTE
jgi:hypothetical protein